MITFAIRRLILGFAVASAAFSMQLSATNSSAHVSVQGPVGAKVMLDFDPLVETVLAKVTNVRQDLCSDVQKVRQDLCTDVKNLSQNVITQAKTIVTQGGDHGARLLMASVIGTPLIITGLALIYRAWSPKKEDKKETTLDWKQLAVGAGLTLAGIFTVTHFCRPLCNFTGR